MLRLSFINLFFLLGCTGTVNNVFNFTPSKSYEEYLVAYNSCTGKGVINSEGSLKGKLPFSFRSQRDSTFLEFSDIIGRKALFVWITNNSITARNLIDNKQYKYDEVTELLPVLKVLEPKDITKIIWGVFSLIIRKGLKIFHNQLKRAFLLILKGKILTTRDRLW